MESNAVGSEPSDSLMRRTIEFRAGLASALSAVTMVALPIFEQISNDLDQLAPLQSGTFALGTFCLLNATLAVVGWWVDSLRSWWGDPPWRHRFRSAVIWIIPILGIFASLDDGRTLLHTAGRSRWAVRAWSATWLIAIVLLPWGSTATWNPPIAITVIARSLFGMALLALVTSSMSSLRAEWCRRDDAVRLPNGQSVGS